MSMLHQSQFLQSRSERAKRTRRLAVVALLLLAAGIVYPPICRAADIPQLTLPQAVAQALRHNSELQTTGEQVRAAKTTVEQKKAGLYPELAASSKSLRQNGDASVVTTALTASVNIFNGFADQAAIAGAGFALLAEQLSFSREQQSVVYQTISAYLAVATNQELIRAAEQSLEENRRQLAQIEAFCKAGKRSRTDLYQQQAETSQAELILLGRHRDLATSRLDLQLLLGLATLPIGIVAPEVPDKAPLPAEVAAPEILAVALVNRPDLVALDRRIEAAAEGVRETKGGLWPKVALFSELSSGYSSKETANLAEQMGDEDLAIGLSVIMPIFDRFATRYAAVQAEIGVNRQRLARQALSQRIGVEVGKAVQALQLAARQIETAESQVRYARQALAASRERYEVGAADIVLLSAARTRAVEAEFDRIKAWYDLLLQRVSVAYATGDSDGMLALFAAPHQG